MKKNISVSLPENLIDKLGKFCEKTERPKSFVVKMALERFFEVQLEMEGIYRELLKEKPDLPFSEEELINQVNNK